MRSSGPAFSNVERQVRAEYAASPKFGSPDARAKSASEADWLIRVGDLGSTDLVRHFTILGLASLCVSLTGCSKSQSSSQPAPPASVAPAEVIRATAPPAENPRDINALFQVEAANRPSGALRVEDALAAFRHAGIALHDERQHLARPYGARYCVGARSGELVLSVCEYIDAAAAETGIASSRKIPLKDREIRLRRDTSLTVRLLHKTPDAQALSTRLFDTFATL